MNERLETVALRLRQLEDLVSDPGLARDVNRYKDTMRERARLSEIMEAYAAYQRLEGEIAGTKGMIHDETDPELKEMAREELHGLEESLVTAEKQVTELLVPRDPLDDKNTIMEIRAGTGGDEAALFVADLYRMYTRYADNKKWKIEVLSSAETGLGGFKEIILSISGEQVFGKLRWESGVHRVQRVPTTEASGRIHTSAVTVAVLPEAEETEVDIRPEDLREAPAASASTPPTPPFA